MGLTASGNQSDVNASLLTDVLSGRLHSRSRELQIDLGEHDASLLDIIGAARRACPAIELPPEVFVAYLGDRLPVHVPLAVALRQTHTADLYLACACARRDVRAFALFEDRCINRLDRMLAKMGICEDLCAEIKQDIRDRVLIGSRGPAEILDYTGRGDLRGWVHVMAARQAVRRQHRARRECPLNDGEMLAQAAVAGSPESEYVKRVYGREFKAAFEGALRDLPDRERLLLRQHYVDALTIDELAALYRVHRSTAARLVERARLLVLEETHARMLSRLEVQPQELESIIRMIRSQLEITLRALRRRRGR
jgi:RNA polymerase sigma-70 factor (ECF subfamily)